MLLQDPRHCRKLVAGERDLAGQPLVLLVNFRMAPNAPKRLLGLPWPQAVYSNLVWRPLVRPRLSSEIGIMRLRDRELAPAAAVCWRSRASGCVSAGRANDRRAWSMALGSLTAAPNF
jgi:hypothetical protein